MAVIISKVAVGVALGSSIGVGLIGDLFNKRKLVAISLIAIGVILAIVTPLKYFRIL